MFNFPLSDEFFLYIQVSQSGHSGSGSPMIEAGAVTSLKPHQRIADEMKRTINLGPNHRGLVIVVLSLLDLTDVLTRKLRFAVYEPRDILSLKSHMQAVDLVELKHHPIIVMVSGVGRDNLILLTECGYINIKEDIMAPLFPPIATHLADNPKIFLFIISNFSEPLHFIEPFGQNYIVGYIACDDLGDRLRVTRIVEDKLAHPSISVQDIFTSISDKLPHTATMTVMDRLKEPVNLHPRRSELMETHSGSQGIVTCL